MVVVYTPSSTQTFVGTSMHGLLSVGGIFVITGAPILYEFTRLLSESYTVIKATGVLFKPSKGAPSLKQSL